MSYVSVVLTIVGSLLACIGTIMIYDARILTKKFFSTEEQNVVTKGMKIIGFFVSIIGVIIVYINIM